MLRDTAMPRRDERAQLAYEGPMQAELLARGAEQIGIRLSDRQLAQFVILASELVEWNRRASLTRVDDPEQIQIRHFLEEV